MIRRMKFEPPETFNMADFFLDARIREGHGDHTALIVGERTYRYRDVQEMAHRYGNLLLEAGVQPEQRVVVALPDGPEFVAALFGILKIGAVVVMLNPDLKPDLLAYFFEYTRAKAAFIHSECRSSFAEAAEGGRFLDHLFVIDTAEFRTAISSMSPQL